MDLFLLLSASMFLLEHLSLNSFVKFLWVPNAPTGFQEPIPHTGLPCPVFFFLLILLSYKFFSAPLPYSPFPFNPLPWLPCSYFTQEILSFSTSHACMSFSGASLLSRFSGSVLMQGKKISPIST